MTDRFSPVDLWRGHIKSLSFRGTAGQPLIADVLARFVLYGVPTALGVTAGVSGFTIKHPDGILAGLSLLIAGLLAVFAQIAAWRDRLTAREASYERSEASDSDSLDEAATHVLVAALASVVGLISLFIGQSTMPAKADGLTGWTCGIVVGICSYIALLFCMVVFKLYDTYVHVYRVSDRVSGHVR